MDERCRPRRWWVGLLLAWSLPWKAVALWKAARRRDLPWYLTLLVVNTAGLLEMLYIFIFSRRTPECCEREART